MAPPKPNYESSNVRSPRYHWDFEAVDAFVELSNLYMGCTEFLEDLKSLLTDAPGRFRKLRIDPLYGVIPEGEDFYPGNASLMLPLPGKTMAFPSSVDQISERYQTTWGAMTSFLESANPWLGRVEDAIDDWGLRAPWGPGAFLEMMVESEVLRRRAKREIPERSPGLAATWTIRQTPRPLMDQPFLSSPTVRPGMTDAQWDEEVDEFRKDGLDILRNWRVALTDTSLWKARPSKMKLHVHWLFSRITPPFVAPEELVQEYPGVSVHAIRSANRKTAKLLGMKIPRGLRRARALQRRPNS